MLVARKFVIRLCTWVFVIFLIHGCGGSRSKPNPPQLYIPITSLFATGVLGVTEASANLPIANTGGESLTFELTVEDWMHPQFRRATIPVGGTSIVNFTFDCAQPGIRRGSIGITTNDPTFETGSIPVELTCGSPALEFSVITKSPIEGTVGGEARGMIEWEVDSPWDGQPSVGYTVRTNRMGVEITNAAGTVAMEAAIENVLTFNCDTALDESYTFTVEAGTHVFTEELAFKCEESEGSQRVVFFQGPLVGWVDLLESDHETSYKQPITQRLPFVPSRHTAVVVEIIRNTVGGARVFADPELIEEIPPIPSASTYEQLESGLIRMRTTFEMPAASVTEEGVIHVVIARGAVGLDDRSNQTFQIPMASFEFANTEELVLRFQPILRDETNTHVDAAPLVEWFVQTMPVSDASIEMLSPILLSSKLASSEMVAERLFDHYVERRIFNELLIGVYDARDESQCGLSFENLPVLMIPGLSNPKCDQMGSFALRTGQSLGITKSVGCKQPTNFQSESSDIEFMRFDSRSSTLLAAPVRGGDFVSECNTDAISSEHYGDVLDRLRAGRHVPPRLDSRRLIGMYAAKGVKINNLIDDWENIGLIEERGFLMDYPFSALVKGEFSDLYEEDWVSPTGATFTGIALGRLTLNNRFYSIGMTSDPRSLRNLHVNAVFDRVNGISSRTLHSWKVEETTGTQR